MKSTHWIFMFISLLMVLAVPKSNYAQSPWIMPAGPLSVVPLNGGNISMQVAINPFPIATTHDWVTGIGIGMTGSTGPASLLLSDAVLLDSNGNVIAQFDFAPNPTTTFGLENGPVITPGAVWFGFHALVEPFTLPPDGIAFLEFSGTIDPNDLEALNGLMAQMAFGVGNGFNPVFDPNDPQRVQYVETNLEVVPEPTTMLLLGTGLASIAIRLRKRRKDDKSSVA